MTEAGLAARPQLASHKRSILLVEDDDAVRRSLQLLLAASGYMVRAYGSPVGLARDPAALSCECLIADLIVPPTDAVALLGDMRSVGWNGRAILISGYLDEHWQDRASAAGFDVALAKPLSETMLVRMIAQLLP